MDDNAKVNLEQATIQSLNPLKKVTPKGTEYWLARDLQGLLGYSQWRNLEEVIEKAKRACEMSANDPRIHFADTSKKVTLGGGSIREIKDVALTRYAAYLVAMNGDSAKPEIAAAQTYFAVQTRKQELAEQKDEDESRLALRNRVKRSNRYLAGAAQRAGVQNFGAFHNAGYQGLYGGLGLSDIKEKKGIRPNDDLLDFIGRAELAANEFRITQTESKLETQQIKGEQAARETHRTVGKEVRNTIEKLGGTMPEVLPAAPSIKQVEKAKKRRTRELPPSS